MRQFLHLIAAVFACCVIGACDTDTAGHLPDDSTAAPARSEVKPMARDERSVKAVLKDPTAFAVADLAGRLGIDPAGIEVVEMRDVTWGDTSLGCPRPGMAYTQTLVNGSLIRLRAADRDYYYHSGAGRKPFYCASPRPPADDTGAFSDI